MDMVTPDLEKIELINKECDCSHCQEIQRQQYRMQHWQKEKICSKK